MSSQMQDEGLGLLLETLQTRRKNNYRCDWRILFLQAAGESVRAAVAAAQGCHRCCGPR